MTRRKQLMDEANKGFLVIPLNSRATDPVVPTECAILHGALEELEKIADLMYRRYDGHEVAVHESGVSRPTKISIKINSKGRATIEQSAVVYFIPNDALSENGWVEVPEGMYERLVEKTDIRSEETRVKYPRWWLLQKRYRYFVRNRTYRQLAENPLSWEFNAKKIQWLDVGIPAQNYTARKMAVSHALTVRGH